MMRPQPSLPFHWLALLTALVLGATLATPALQAELYYTRSGVAAGEWWRLISGNLLHGNLAHAFTNLLGLGLLLAIAREAGLRVTVLHLALLCIGSSLLLYLLFPTIQWMAGLSGPLHGLAVFLLLQARHGCWRAALPLLAMALLAKIALELAGLLSAPVWLNLPLLPQAHLCGVLAGMLITLLAGQRRQHSLFFARVPTP